MNPGTAEELIATTRRIGSIPATSSRGSSDPDILRALNELAISRILPNIMRVREDYLVARCRIDIARNEVRTPPRAALDKFRMVYWVDGDRRVKVNLVDREALSYVNVTKEPQGYFLDNNYLCLVPDAAFSGQVEFHYYQRPNRLVLSTECRQVASVAGQVITLSSAPPSSWQEGDLLDVQSGLAGAELKALDLEITDIAGSDVTVAQKIDGSVFGSRPVAEGDWVALQGEAAVLSLPIDWYPILCEAVAQRFSVNAGDYDGAKMHGSAFVADAKGLITVSEERSEGSPKRVKGRRGIFRRM